MEKRRKMKTRATCFVLVISMIMTLASMTRVYGEAADPTMPEPVEPSAGSKAAVTVATYNGAPYETLEAALEAVDDGDATTDTIVLESDIVIDGVIETGIIDKNITLDLNGKTISGIAQGALVQVASGKTLTLLKGTINNTSQVTGGTAISGTVDVPDQLDITPVGSWKTEKLIRVVDKTFTARITTKMNGSVSAAGGSVKPKTPTVAYGGNLVVDIAANPGYEVKSVTVDGVYKGKENQLTLTKVVTNHNIVVDFVPRSVYIMLDPGHGSSEINQVGSYQEHQRMWILTNYLKEELEKFLGFVVDLTKQAVEETPGVYLRGQRSQEYDLLISMHSNWYSSAATDYPLAIVSSGSALNAKAKPIGTTLASVVQTTMGTAQSPQVWTKKQSDGTDWYGVIRGAASVGTPSVILEHSFHSNTKARNWLMSNSNLRKMAIDEATAIAQYYGLTTKAATTTVVYSPKKVGVTLKAMTVLKSPSPYATGIGRFSSGITIKVDALVIGPDGTSWYKVYTNGQYGYILQEDVKLTVDTSQTARYIGFSPSRTGVTSKYMIVRGDHSSTSSGIGTFRKGTKIKLNGLYTATNGVEWYKVNVNGKYGYVLAREISSVGDTTPTTPTTPSTPTTPTPSTPKATYKGYSPSKLSLALTGMTVHSKPSSTSARIGTFKAGSILKLNGLHTTASGVKWYKVYTNGKYGYILAKNVTLLTYSAYSPSKIGVTNNEMIVRSDLSTSSVGIGRFHAGTRIKLNGLYTGANGVKWYKVYTNGKYGYILAKYVTLK
ncbi:MAG: SH3 domain-containing protein [Anaerovoracaceae bacterium]|jgi:N-acetylmuramoyl-L-alanine amidase